MSITYTVNRAMGGSTFFEIEAIGGDGSLGAARIKAAEESRSGTLPVEVWADSGTGPCLTDTYQCGEETGEDPRFGYCDGCHMDRPDIRSVGRDANGDPDAPDLCGVCRERL